MEVTNSLVERKSEETLFYYRLTLHTWPRAPEFNTLLDVVNSTTLWGNIGAVLLLWKPERREAQCHRMGQSLSP